MFLQYALWGAWLPVTARYLSASIEDGGLGLQYEIQLEAACPKLYRGLLSLKPIPAPM